MAILSIIEERESGREKFQFSIFIFQEKRKKTESGRFSINFQIENFLYKESTRRKSEPKKDYFL